jgi:hypothetical protein
MPAFKKKNRSGKIVWAYMFSPPGASRANRARISKSGFATKREAEDAEAQRRIDENQKQDLAKVGASVAGPLPKTLAMLIEEVFRQHVDQKLAPKTVERYHQQAASLSPELLADVDR